MMGAHSPEDLGLASFAATRSPRYARLLAVLVGALLAASLLACVVVPWQQTAFGAGRVVAYAPLERQQAIEAPLDGRVKAWHVQEGSVVRPGDPLVDLTDNDPIVLERLAQEAAALQQRLEAVGERVVRLVERATELGRSRENALSGARARAAMAGDRVEAARHGLVAARARVTTAGLNLDRQRALVARGLAARRSLELAELERTQATAEADRAAATLAAATTEVVSFRADLGRQGTDQAALVAEARAAIATARSDEASVRADLVRVQGRLARQGAQVVRASRAGTVMRLVAAEGNAIVKAGDPLAILVPSDEVRAVEVWVGGRDAPWVKPGRVARVQVDGWPAIQALGWPSVAFGTFPGRVVLVDAAADDRGMLRVVIVPDPPSAWPERVFTRPGVLAQAWVLLAQVPIGFEIWRQFGGMPPAVVPGKGRDGDVIDLKKRK